MPTNAVNKYDIYCRFKLTINHIATLYSSETETQIDNLRGMAARWADGRTVPVDVSVLASHVIEIATPRFYVRCQLTEDGAVLSFDLVQLSLRAPSSVPSFVLTEQP